MRFILLLILTSCSLQEKHQESKVKRHNQTGELILRKDSDKSFLVPAPKASPTPIYPWVSRLNPHEKIHLEQ